MTNKQLIVKIAAVLSTLAETTKPGEYAIASMIYLAFGSNIADYDYVIGFGKHAGWLTATSETVLLTPKGREKAEQIAAVLG